MNDILIVPDIHGRDFWKPALEYKGEVIFLGDYTDPYSSENFSDEDAYQSLLKIIDFKQKNPNRVTLLIGNHELHYYDSNFECVRFSEDYYERFNELLTQTSTADLFQVCKQIDNYLFIHAGITKNWYDLHQNELLYSGTTLEKQINNLFIDYKMPFSEVSFYRGGFHTSGSPLWADIYEFIDESKPFDKDIIQIIGHTLNKATAPIEIKNIRLLDNRRLYLLSNGEIKNYCQN